MSLVKTKLSGLDSRTDAILGTFHRELDRVADRARLTTLLELRDRVTLTSDGRIAMTAGNVRAVRTLPATFRRALRESGYDDLVSRFLNSFEGGIPTFESVIAEISRRYQIPAPGFSSADRALFRELKTSVGLSLETLASTAADAVANRATFVVGGQPFPVVAATLSSRLKTSLGRAETVAATGISTFYRTVAARGYDRIEKELAPVGRELRYTYEGPPSGDKLIRPFCKRLMVLAAAGRTWTRRQIESMDNGQLPDSFTTAGGFNCRHQWVVSLESNP